MNPSMTTLARAAAEAALERAADDDVHVDLAALDGAAFERLYGDHVAQVQRVVRRYLWGTVVDDVVQETFAQAYRSGLHLEAHPRRAQWVAQRLCGMAKNRSIDVLRFRMRGLEEVPDDGRLLAREATDGDPEQAFQTARRREGIAEALDGLCGRQRRMIVMHYVEGRSYEEIAQAEDMSVEAVRSTLARGRRTFRDLYATIADRKGLSVVLGGWITRLQARLREARDRVATALQQAGGAVTAATPVVGNTLVAAFLVGGLAVGAMASAVVATEAATPVSAATPAEPDSEPPPAEAELQSPEPEPEPEAEPERAPAPDPELEQRAVPRAPVPVAVRAARSADAKVDSADVAPSEHVPGRARAGASAGAGADTEERTIEQEVAGDVRAVGSALDGGADTTQDVQAGCFDGKEYHDPVTDAACGSPDGAAPDLDQPEQPMP